MKNRTKFIEETVKQLIHEYHNISHCRIEDVLRELTKNFKNTEIAKRLGIPAPTVSDTKNKEFLWTN